MNKEYIFNELVKKLDKKDIKIDEPMKKHISFKVGGPADILVRPRNEEQIRYIMNLIKEEKIPFLIIGNGSNLIIRDGGIRGIVIELSDNFSEINIENNIVEVQSGALLSIIGHKILESSLKGFEFATGIPGTIGGAVSMNAGAYGGEISEIVKSVRVMDLQGNINEYSNEEMDFGYRRSIITNNPYIVLSCKIELENGDYDEIKKNINELADKRKTKQPLNFPSAGSTFKRPEGHFAGQLIDESGLRGFTHKGAQVSEKHCGFVINKGNATANDLLELISIIKERVYSNTGVMLEEEVKILGEN
ncbi:MAG: UDP-N-acetylmuramate dehydrogenase [Clostridioides sp.]|nr:UDP-N-acetylmuramate dehydrogenase [Clostridioides sp.]